MRSTVDSAGWRRAAPRGGATPNVAASNRRLTTWPPRQTPGTTAEFRTAAPGDERHTTLCRGRPPDALTQAFGARLAGAFRAGAVFAAGFRVVGRPGWVTVSSALLTALPASATTSPAFAKVSLTSGLRRSRRTTSSPRWASDS